MAKQLLLLCAVTLGLGAEAITHPPGSIQTVDDDVADDLLKLEPPAAKLDNSELPAQPRRRRAAAAPSAPPEPDQPAGDGEGGSPADPAAEAGGGEAAQG